jgi:plastocyanin
MSDMKRLQNWKSITGRVVSRLTVVAALCATSAALSASPVRISQKDQQFRPGDVVIAKGDAIEIVNDDGDILHHAYVESDTFSFDSGDQQPGSHTLVTFSVAGTFDVLCGIHPRMKLVVHVN